MSDHIAVKNKTPISCDTFVVIPENDGPIIFGKNSDRPEEEVQDIVYFKRQEYPKGTTVTCTYIEIEQASETHGIILSKPNWMWGAEMGANEFGVCIGNEAVSTKLESEDDKEEKLLGMDLLRLGLERGKTALEALNVITSLLEKYGQGGSCSNTGTWTYHNSFIICDTAEAYVLETARTLWAVEKVKGYRNLSNCLSIGTNIYMMSEGLKDKAQQLGLWSGVGDFHFARSFSDENPEDCPRFANGLKLLREHTTPRGSCDVENMIKILRDEESGIAMREGIFQSTSSQVSVLHSSGSRRPNVHWFTGTPDPVLSVFKPFVFTKTPSLGTLLVSTDSKTPHRIYALHETAKKCKPQVFNLLAAIEKKCIMEVSEFLDKIENGEAPLSELDDLFKDCAETEEKFYK